MVLRISDAVALDGVADKWGVDGQALTTKISSIGDIPSIALADWAEQAWAKDDLDIESETAIFKGE